MKLINVEDMMRIAKETVESAPADIPPEIKEILIGVIVGIYIKGVKNGIKISQTTNEMVMADLKKSEDELKSLYAL